VAAVSIYHTPSTISALVLVNKTKNEYPPPTCISREVTMCRHNLNRGSLRGNNVELGFISSVPTGMCDIPYESHIIDRYPKADYESFEFPMNLPMFIFPKGLPLLRRPLTDAPMPSYFPLVFTGGDGKYIHAACLTFYEELPSAAVDKLKVRHERIHATGSQELDELRRESMVRSESLPPPPATEASRSSTSVTKYVLDRLRARPIGRKHAIRSGSELAFRSPRSHNSFTRASRSFFARRSFSHSLTLASLAGTAFTPPSRSSSCPSSPSTAPSSASSASSTASP